MRIAAVCLALVALASCSGGVATVPVLAPAAAAVRVGKTDADPSCRDLGPIEIAHGDGCYGTGDLGTYEGAYNALRNLAAERGGTYVRMDHQMPPHPVTPDCYDNRFVIRGVVFACRAPTP